MAAFISAMSCFVFVFVCLLGVATAADGDLYQDLPDVLNLEELAKSWEARHMQQLQLQRRFGVLESDVTDVAAPMPDFSYQFAPDQQVSPFAVGPTDPRYYQDSVQLVQENKESQRMGEEDDDTFEPPQSQPQPLPRATVRPAQSTAEEHVLQVPTHAQEDSRDHIYFIAIVGGCSAAAVVGVIAIAISWYKLQRNAKAAADVEYPAYGVTGPHKDSSPTGDRKLAQSAQMYHYQHQKQQIIALENRVASERAGSVSDAESDEENEEGDYTVYECPGLAPAGEMEVKNPLFLDDPTPATPAVPANHSRPGDVTSAKK